MTLPPSFPPESSPRNPNPGSSSNARPESPAPTFPSHETSRGRPDSRNAVVVGGSSTPNSHRQGLSYEDLALPAAYAPGSAANYRPGSPGIPNSPGTPPVRAASPRPAPDLVTSPEPVLPASQPRTGTTRTRSWPKRIFLTIFTLFLALILAIVFWGLFLIHRVDTNLGRTDALSGAADTPGTTWLIAGSDSREGTAEANSGVEGQRSDTILLLHQATNGTAILVSLPRDTYVEIPGHGHNKLNAAFSIGGPALLVSTVEGLTGLSVDHYAQLGFNGVAQVVDGVGGINLCWDQTFSDRMTGLNWQAGCHDVDGPTALLFARMRYSDPLGDIGRTQRQRLVISSTLKKALSPEVLVNPARQVALADAGAAALTVDRSTGALDIGRMALALRKAGNTGLQGVPPIASLGYNPGGGVGSTVKLDESRTPAFWEGLRNGTLTPADLTPQF